MTDNQESNLVQVTTETIPPRITFDRKPEVRGEGPGSDSVNPTNTILIDLEKKLAEQNEWLHRVYQLLGMIDGDDHGENVIEEFRRRLDDIESSGRERVPDIMKTMRHALGECLTFLEFSGGSSADHRAYVQGILDEYDTAYPIPHPTETARVTEEMVDAFDQEFYKQTLRMAPNSRAVRRAAIAAAIRAKRD